MLAHANIQLVLYSFRVDQKTTGYYRTLVSRSKPCTTAMALNFVQLIDNSYRRYLTPHDEIADPTTPSSSCSSS